MSTSPANWGVGSGDVDDTFEAAGITRAGWGFYGGAGGLLGGCYRPAGVQGPRGFGIIGTLDSQLGKLSIAELQILRMGKSFGCCERNWPEYTPTR